MQKGGRSPPRSHHRSWHASRLSEAEPGVVLQDPGGRGIRILLECGGQGSQSGSPRGWGGGPCLPETGLLVQKRGGGSSWP